MYSFSIFFSSIILLISPSLFAEELPSTAWKITRTEWTAQDEIRYGEFIESLGASGCNTIDQCLKSSANPYRASDPIAAKFYTDCADLPYYLRAYFAWKNGLPFAYADDVAAIATEATTDDVNANDVRYSSKGNKIIGQHSIRIRKSQDGNLLYPNALTELARITDDISSAMFRFDPDTDYSPENGSYPDFFPVAINRKAIRPGTAFYDPQGHVGLVYRVEQDGRILYMDAHPDGSVTHGTYGEAFIRSRPGHGAGFKNFRPLSLVGAEQNAQGIFVGGRIKLATNAELSDFSKIQFLGNKPDPRGYWAKGQFLWEGTALNYYDFVRRSMALGKLQYEPIVEVGNMLKELCQSIKDRVESVNRAVKSGLDQKPHPERLPLNIYGTNGEWEEYSTPSRDARLKTSFRELRKKAEEFLTLNAAHDASIFYQGQDLKSDLQLVLNQENEACELSYTRSNGEKRSMSLKGIMKGLFALSFDPYHCIEHRWGETDPTILSSCVESDDKTRWYLGEQRLRNQLERNYEARMDFSLEQLFVNALGNGTDTPPDVDLEAFLAQ